LAVALLALAAVGLSGCASTSVVHVRDFRFDPSQLSIESGGVAKFISDGTAAHTVTVQGPDGATLKDTEVQTGETVDVTFAGAGTYQVTCRFHDAMRLTVTAK